VPVCALVEPDPIRKSVVLPVSPTCFDFASAGDENAIGAVLILARDIMGDPQDVIAWNAKTGLLRSLYGRARVLGEDEVLMPRLDCGGCIRIWRNPLDWLRARRRGVVLLNGITSASLLAEVGSLVVDDAAHRREVLRVIARPLPLIHIADRREVA
jgi:hypothetical protein